MSKQIQATRRSAFTLVELMVVVGIIAVLISVLIPVIASVRIKAYDADTKNWVQQLTAAIESYHTDFRAYPGPIPDHLIWNTGANAADFDNNGFDVAVPAGVNGFSTVPGNLYQQITGSENLVLGLLGGLRRATSGELIYDPSIVGLGAMSLNPASPKRGRAYLDAMTLSWHDINSPPVKTGLFADGTGGAFDTLIPEFVDKYPGAEMPILYLRSKRGVKQLVPPPVLSANHNSVITNNGADPAGPPGPGAFRVGAYDISSILGYTNSSIGEGKRIKSSEYVNTGSGSLAFPSHGLRTVDPTKTSNIASGTNYVYPLDAFPYFQNPGMPGTARNKDTFILISAGADRVYGTRDDIVSFGAVGE